MSSTSPTANSDTSPGLSAFRRVPVRTILLALTLFWLSFEAVRLFSRLSNIFTYIVIAAFFAMMLTPAVNFCMKKFHMSKGLSTLVIFVVALVLLGGMLFAFITPIVNNAPQFAKSFPEYIHNVKYCGDQYKGSGKSKIPSGHSCPSSPVTDLIVRFHLTNKLDSFSNDIATGVNDVKKNAKDIASTVGHTVAGTLTVLVLLILMLLRGDEVLNRFISPLRKETQDRIRKVGRDSAHAVTSYMFGNVLISVIAGLGTLAMLAIFSVEFKTALSLWVGFADLIPLVGATIGAIPAILVAFLHSTAAGVGMIIFFVVYQQFENHVLQVTIMARTVALDPLLVLISVLMGAQLFGILGALLAIPVAGAIQVIIRDIIEDRHRSHLNEITDPPPTPPSLDAKA